MENKYFSKKNVTKPNEVLIGYLFQFAFLAAVLVWLLYIRDRYFRYTEHAKQRT